MSVILMLVVKSCDGRKKRKRDFAQKIDKEFTTEGLEGGHTCSFVVFKGFRFFAPETSSPPFSKGGN